MRTPTIGRSGAVETMIVSLITFAALALLGLVLAYWTWVAFAPRPEPRVQAAGEAVRIDSAHALFGSAHRAAIAPTGMALTLVGVAAASGGRPGHTVVQIDGRQTVVVREGEEIAPGIRLAEVHSDHVVLDHKGQRETLAWPQPDRMPVLSAPPKKP